MAVPLITIEGLCHHLFLLLVEVSVSGQTEIQTTFAHHVPTPLGPHHIEILGAIEDILSRRVR